MAPPGPSRVVLRPRKFMMWVPPAPAYRPVPPMIDRMEGWRGSNGDTGGACSMPLETSMSEGKSRSGVMRPKTNSWMLTLAGWGRSSLLMNHPRQIHNPVAGALEGSQRVAPGDRPLRIQVALDEEDSAGHVVRRGGAGRRHQAQRLPQTGAVDHHGAPFRHGRLATEDDRSEPSGRRRSDTGHPRPQQIPASYSVPLLGAWARQTRIHGPASFPAARGRARSLPAPHREENAYLPALIASAAGPLGERAWAPVREHDGLAVGHLSQQPFARLESPRQWMHSSSFGVSLHRHPLATWRAKGGSRWNVRNGLVSLRASAPTRDPRHTLPPTPRHLPRGP